MFSRYLQLVDIFRWVIELRRVDIFHETFLVLQYQYSPQIGRHEVIYHIFAYSNIHMKMGRIDYYPMVPNSDLLMSNNNADWSEFYWDIEEYFLQKMLEPHGRYVSIYLFIDANHAGNALTRHSHNGSIMFIHNAPIICLYKKQSMVEVDTFGSEFVALMICNNLIVTLIYKLSMFGVRFEGPVYIFCYNCGVVRNMSILESVIHKKHHTINYL